MPSINYENSLPIGNNFINSKLLEWMLDTIILTEHFFIKTNKIKMKPKCIYSGFFISCTFSFYFTMHIRCIKTIKIKMKLKCIYSIIICFVHIFVLFYDLYQTFYFQTVRASSHFTFILHLQFNSFDKKMPVQKD